MSQTVAVLGGGISGLTAAHELAERGFDVTVYESRQWGGKARSIEVPNSAQGGRLPLPGEHGFRIFFGFYENNPDTFRRIPFAGNANGVFDNLVGVPQLSFSRAGKRDIVLPVKVADPRAYTPTLIHETVLAALLQLNLPPDAAACFANRIVVFFSSCDARRHSDWDTMPWTTFIRTAKWPGDYSDILSEAWAHMLQASLAPATTTDFVGTILEWIIYNLIGLNSTAPPDRVLGGPTNEMLIKPWVKHLGTLGAKMQLGYSVTGLELAGGRISGAQVVGPKGPSRIQSDWYVCALPVERARQLWSNAILAAAPELKGTLALKTAWMNGIQLYLKRRAPVIRGHIACLNSPWMVSGVAQAQFWPTNFAQTYGDGQAQDCLSTVISDWNTPGLLYGKPACECTDQEIVDEIWAQFKQHLNDPSDTPLTDDLLLSYHVDPGLARVQGRLTSEDPLVLPSLGSWANRPEVGTKIPNLVLAGDYVRGDWQMANMEAANVSGRTAAKTVISRSGANTPPVTIHPRYRPPEWQVLKSLDATRLALHQPNLFDLDMTF
ncbi:MAG: FAD-dependent oxidoreductase, partial [Aeromicrobium sp.]